MKRRTSVLNWVFHSHHRFQWGNLISCPKQVLWKIHKFFQFTTKKIQQIPTQTPERAFILGGVDNLEKHINSSGIHCKNLAARIYIWCSFTLQTPLIGEQASAISLTLASKGSNVISSTSTGRLSSWPCGPVTSAEALLKQKPSTWNSSTKYLKLSIICIRNCPHHHLSEPINCHKWTDNQRSKLQPSNQVCCVLIYCIFKWAIHFHVSCCEYKFLVSVFLQKNPHSLMFSLPDGSFCSC